MANSIALAKKYVPLLDEVYKNAALTADLESDATLTQAGANTNEIIIPKISMDGLADYSRNSGYVSGDVDLSWETVKFNYERGRMFTVDAMDNEESQNLAFGRLAGEFVRTKVVPELDAFRFATYAGISGISKATAATISDGAGVISALRAATNKLDEDEVPLDQRFLYITPTLYGMVQDLDTTKSREVIARFTKLVQVPQTRFYTAIELLDGSSSGETAGGYKKYGDHYAKSASTVSGAKEVVADSTQSPTDSQIKLAAVTPVATGYTPAIGDYVVTESGKEINFLVCHKPAIMQYTKHAVPKIISPEMNQDADAYKYGYRNYGLSDVYENKVAGIYLSAKA